jgi:hypothetical protein
VGEVASGRSERPIAGLKAPGGPESVERSKQFAARFDRDTGQLPAFAAGDRVRARSSGSPGHTRLPQYVRGHRGVVQAVRGVHVLPDTNLRDDGPAEPLYTVSFAAAELWPEASGRRDRVYLDLWESYLERP